MSFQGLSVAFDTVKIVKDLMEIWLNEVCDRYILFQVKPTCDWVSATYLQSEVPLSKSISGILMALELQSTIFQDISKWI